MPVFTPGSTTSGSCPRYCARQRRPAPGSAAAPRWRGPRPSMLPRVDAGGGEQVAHEDAVLVGGLLAARGEPPVRACSVAPSWTPRTVLVLPTSMVRSRVMGLRSGRGSPRSSRTSPRAATRRALAVVELEDERAALVEVARDAAQHPVTRTAPRRARPHHGTARARHAASSRRAPSRRGHDTRRRSRRQDRGRDVRRRAGATPSAERRDASRAASGREAARDARDVDADAEHDRLDAGPRPTTHSARMPRHLAARRPARRSAT